MSVIIKVDTGFVGAIHEEDTGLTVKEWNDLDSDGKYEYLRGAINDNIESYAVDEDDEDTILDF